MKTKLNTYPVIWKKEKCLVGQCKDLCRSHWWSVPMCSPQGLMTQCFNCGKTRIVNVEKETPKWMEERKDGEPLFDGKEHFEELYNEWKCSKKI